MVTPLQIDKIRGKAIELGRHSWEYGVITQALLELHEPQLSLFADDLNQLRTGAAAQAIQDSFALSYARKFIRTDHDTLVDGEGAAGDPPSLGIPALLLGTSDHAFATAVQKQKDTLCNRTPKFENGAISHRSAVAELWSDFTFMVPPFLAFEAFMQDHREDLLRAIRECHLQYEILRKPVSNGGLWMHIVGPQHPDPGCWSTGVGWAVMGMVRVLDIAKAFLKTQPDDQLSKSIKELREIICDTLRAVTAADLDTNGLVRNYVDDSSWFGEKAGTAALASAIFRLAVLESESLPQEHIKWALAAMDAVCKDVGENGEVGPVVNPMNASDRTPITASAEGQAFALLLIAAHRDWKAWVNT